MRRDPRVQTLNFLQGRRSPGCGGQPFVRAVLARYLRDMSSAWPGSGPVASRVRQPRYSPARMPKWRSCLQSGPWCRAQRSIVFHLSMKNRASHTDVRAGANGGIIVHRHLPAQFPCEARQPSVCGSGRRSGGMIRGRRLARERAPNHGQTCRRDASCRC